MTIETNVRGIRSAFESGALSAAGVRELLRELADTADKPLSIGQRGLWVLDRAEPDSSAYNVPIAFSIRDLDVDALGRACALLVERVPMLRSVFVEEGGVLSRRVRPPSEGGFECEDASGMTEDALVAHLREHAKRPFDLARGPLFRVLVCQGAPSPESSAVLLCVHHIIFDGGSLRVVLRTLVRLYEALRTGQAPLVESPTATFDEFVVRERELIEGPEGRARIAYWQAQLATASTSLALPSDRAVRGEQSVEGRSLQRGLPAALGARIQALSASARVYPSTIFAAAFGVLLHRHTQQRDILVGMPVDARPPSGFEAVVGFFVDMLPIRSRLEPGQSFSDTLASLQHTLVDAIACSLPLPALLPHVDIAEPSGPVFEAAFMYQDFLQDVVADSAFEALDGVRQEGEYRLTLEVLERDVGFEINFKYDGARFDTATISAFSRQLVRILEEACARPDDAVEDYDLICQDERALLEGWNSTDEPYSRDACMHQLFAAYAAAEPGEIAVSTADATLTYGALAQASQRVSAALQDLGVGVGQRVALVVPRGTDLMAGLLGILGAGAAYVPIDPQFPVERQAMIVEDCGAPVVVTTAALESAVGRLVDSGPESTRPRVLTIEELSPSSAPRVPVSVTSSDLAYVIYTSGSAGRPKGVAVSHGALSNLLQTMAKRPGFGADDVMLAVTTCSFDIAALELFLPLITGGRCDVCETDVARDPEALRERIATVRPTVMQATPSTWRALFQSGWQNSERVRIWCGGEALPESLADDFARTQCEVWNMYGPTETTIWSTVDRVRAGQRVTIGRPIGNTQVYVVGEGDRRQPIGIPGELCIAGDGVAEGYAGNPSLTAEKFVADPFAGRGRMYRTGDLARWRSDGRVEYLGRIDGQVKVRGFRVEVGEVEHRLESHPGIATVAVVARSHEGTQQLVAYYVAPGGSEAGPPTRASLRAHVERTLPGYMVPAHFVAVDRLPLTPNAKVDRKALRERNIVLAAPEEPSAPAPGTAALAERVPPPSPAFVEPDLEPESKPDPGSKPQVGDEVLEGALLQVWSEVLGVEGIRATDGFMDVGGDSVLGVTLAARIAEQFQVPFSVTQLFKHPSVRELAVYVRDYGDALRTPPPPRPRPVAARAHEPAPPPAPPASGRRTDASESRPDVPEDSFAIVGMSCQFPGAPNVDAFWDNLKHGVQGTRFFSEDDLRAAGVPAERITDPSFVPTSTTIDGKEDFDPAFFRMSPKSAVLMDPQFRLLLMNVWRAVEDAGYAPSDVPDTSVYVSTSNNFHHALLERAQVIEPSEAYVAWLFAQGGTIPTTISYELGFRGPSIFVHTNCSSSLVGLSMACQSLRAGDARQAIVGAASLSAATQIGYVHRPGLNLSSDGRCRTFDAQADGMTTGEGVGVLMIKTLADAIADGDQIYAAIRGVALNNDGADKAGYYAPGVRGQSEVIDKALRKAGVDASSIDYVECHGTGTKLGDPIEVLALTDVYRQYTSELQRCGLGSVKPNIGHLDTVSALAGCIKVALMLRHRQMPPQVNYETPNPEIDFASSPFYVVDRLQRWRKPRGESKRDAGPLRAALSSFGIGGTNGHAIFEEYRTPPPTDEELVRASDAQSEAPTHIVVLSARSGEQLRAYAESLKGFIAPERPRIELGDLAYTLQVGRMAMRHRVAFIVADVETLRTRISEFLAADSPRAALRDTFVGDAKQASRLARVLDADEDLRELVTKWARTGKHHQVAAVWVEGSDTPWRALHVGVARRRVSVPTYPFVSKVLRVEDFARAEGSPPIPTPSRSRPPSPTAGSPIHPLLQEQDASAAEPRFVSTFGGDEFFFRDHVIHGRRMLPGVCYLEMVVAATGEPRESVAMLLEDVVWLQPIVADGPTGDVVVQLDPQGVRTRYEVRSQVAGEAVVHCQGAIGGRGPSEAESPRDVAALVASCPTTIAAEAFYGYLARGGGDYGASLRSIESIHKNPREMVARVRLPASARADAEGYRLHPSIMDAAFQLTDSLLLQPGAQGAYLPFFVKSVQVHRRTPAEGYVHVRFSDGARPDASVVKYDIEILDELGRVCVVLREFTARAMQTGATRHETLYLQPQWMSGATEAVPAPTEGQVHLFVDAVGPQPLEAPGARVERLPRQAGLGETLHAHYATVFAQVQRCIRDSSRSDHFLLVVVSADDEPAVAAPLVGLLKVAHQESERVRGRVVFVEGLVDADPERLAAVIRRERTRAGADEVEVLHTRDGDRRVSRMCELHVERAPTRAVKQGGVYWITGGTGKLGLQVAESLLDAGARVVLSARSPLDAAAQAAVDRLNGDRARVFFERADVSSLVDVTRVCRSIETRLGSLTGVFHCAGVVRDGWLVDKTLAQVREVFAPKVDGLLAIDRATAHLPLDFIVSFASTSGVFGNVGQAGYAAANAFVDAFSAHRNGLVARGERSGKTISIDWPLWEDGGMRFDPQTERTILGAQGLVPMRTATGLQALHYVLAAGSAQVAVLEGDAKRLRRAFLRPPEPATKGSSATPVKPTSSASAQTIRAAFDTLVVGFVSRLTGVAVDEVERDTEFGELGLDSILLTTLSNQLNDELDLVAAGTPLAPTVFFEYPTVSEVVDYLAKRCGDAIGGLGVAEVPESGGAEPAGTETLAPESGGAEPARAESVLPPTARPGSPAGGSAQPRPSTWGVEESSPAPRSAATSASDDVAIVGMSGAFPQAGDVDEYWENLIAGRHCITEIPEHRWDWREFYGDPATEENKTNVKWGGFMPGVEEFDPLFFRISSNDAVRTDPQQRLLLMHAWRALEDAGYDPTQLAGSRAGVFVGVGQSGYNMLVRRSGVGIEGKSVLGALPSLAPNRLSHFLDLHGPSEPIETACSSSLVAIHRAVTSLHNGDCDLAIVGGIQTILTPHVHISFSKAGMLSVDGKCKTFSDRADGYVRGEGIGVLILQRLDDAQRQRAPVRAVVKGTAINHGGRANTLTSPNPKAQADVITRAYARAGVDPRTVNYIETHGTGTPLGDPIEINALKGSFESMTEAEQRRGGPALAPQRCGLGSVKTNIGHLELAAGVASVVKVLQQLRHEMLAPSIHCEQINPYIELDDSPFYVVRQPQRWEPVSDAQGVPLPRRAGVSSFGFGGVNAHVVLEEYVPPPRAASAPAGTPVLIVLSAKTPEALRRYAQSVVAFVESSRETCRLEDLAYTLQVGRAALDERLAGVVRSFSELRDRLRAFVEGQSEGMERGRVAPRRGGRAPSGSSPPPTVDLDLLARRFVAGEPIEWSSLHGADVRRISGPTYPFSTRHYWAVAAPQPTDADDDVSTAGADAGAEGRRAARESGALQVEDTSNFDECCFSAVLEPGAPGLPSGGELPPAVVVEVVRRAALQAWPVHDEEGSLQLHEHEVVEPVGFEDATEINVSFAAVVEGARAYEVYSHAPAVGPCPRIVHARGVVRIDTAASPPAGALDGLRERLEPHGDGFIGADEGLFPMTLDAPAGDRLFPTIIDTIVRFDASLGALTHARAVPVAAHQPSAWCHIRRSETSKGARLDASLFDVRGKPTSRIVGLEFRRDETRFQGPSGKRKN